MTSSYLTDLAARNHRADLQREASQARAARRARGQESAKQGDFGEPRSAGRAHRAWHWLATAQI